MENCPDAIKAMEEGNCLFGTVDTWLIWVRERGEREREGTERVRGGEGEEGRRKRVERERESGTSMYMYIGCFLEILKRMKRHTLDLIVSQNLNQYCGITLEIGGLLSGIPPE
jgi:hypothetical protein